jgi:O-antigen/teichoic acid export membrane protein
MPLQMALMTIQGSIPRLYAQGRMQDLEKYYRTVITMAAIPALIGILICAIFPSQVLTLIFGESFSAASTIVIPLFVGLVALVFFGSPADVLAITGNHRLVLSVNVLSAITLVASGVIGAYFAGAIGLAIGSSIAAVLQNGMLWWIARKRLGIWTHLKLIGWSR